MTREQYEKYLKLDNDLKSIREFLCWCGKKYKDEMIRKPRFNLITKGKKLFLHKEYYADTEANNTYDIPLDLQDRIIDVIESYLDEKEEELMNI